MTSCTVERHCPVCNADLRKEIEYTESSRILNVDCPVCGHFKIGRPDLINNQQIKDTVNGEVHILSAILRRKSSEENPITLDKKTTEQLLEATVIPRTPVDKMNTVLQYFEENSGEAGTMISINPEIDYPIAYAKNIDELNFLLKSLKEMMLLECTGSGSKYRLTIIGWEKVMDLLKQVTKTAQAFVAMWFDDSMTPVWQNAIRPALKECGYDPMRIDNHEHNNKICDEIISEIRKSGLMVADFTGQRGGVYYEAGFAMGLGIPVIWTCHKDCVNSLHFDTRQYNHIAWTDEEDLYKQLKKRIEATGLSLRK